MSSFVISTPRHASPPAFTLVETLLMLFALGVFSFTTLAVLKKDQFSLNIILAKFQTGGPTSDLKVAPEKQHVEIATDRPNIKIGATQPVEQESHPISSKAGSSSSATPAQDQ